MTDKQRQKLIEHYEHYLGSPHLMGLRNHEIEGSPIDVLIFAPNKQYPYWKLVTIGASDNIVAGKFRQEYMMFIPERERIMNTLSETNPAVLNWYYSLLMNAAMGPRKGRSAIYRTVVGMEFPDSDMKGYMLMLPANLKDTGVLYCKLNENKVVMSLNVMPLTGEEVEMARREGNESLEQYLQPQRGYIHFLSEKVRHW